MELYARMLAVFQKAVAEGLVILSKIDMETLAEMVGEEAEEIVNKEKASLAEQI